MSSQKVINQIDVLICQGQGTKALELLEEVRPKNLSPESLVLLARHARRLYRPDLVLKWLNPVVRPTAPPFAEPSPAELSEYGGALILIGAISEGLDLLKQVAPERYPSALLYQAFGHFNQWNYPDAIPYLTAYLDQQISDYERLVGHINLAAALLAVEAFAEAEKLLAGLVVDLKDSPNRLLYGNCLELCAQLKVEQGLWEEAESHLFQAEQVLTNTSGRPLLFVRKWLAMIRWLRGIDEHHEDFLRELEQLRHQAVQDPHWETVRDIDLIQATIQADEDLLLTLFYGTPHNPFRQRLTRLYGRHNELPKIPKHWKYTASVHPPSQWLDLLRGTTNETSTHKIKLMQKPLLHGLLFLLTQDFFKPIKLGELFSKLYPDEYYDPFSSPNRIHQLIARLRNWFKKTNLDAEIVESPGGYKLNWGPKCGVILVHPDYRQMCDPRLTQVKLEFGNQPFSSSQVSQVLDLNSRSLLRFLKDAVNAGYMQKTGSGPKTKYQLTELSSRQAA